MRRRGTRLGAVAIMLLAIGSAGLAAAPPAMAADPIVVGSCATSIQGTPGQPIALSPSAVLEPISNLIEAIPLLGPPLVTPFRQAFVALPPIPLGTVAAGTSTIPGSHIADQVISQLDALPLLGPVIGLLTNGVRQTLTTGCGIVVQGLNAVAAPVQDGTKALANASGQATGSTTPPGKPGTGSSSPGTSVNPAGPSSNPQGPPAGTAGIPVGHPGISSSAEFPYYLGRAPLFSYADLPFAIPGRFALSPDSLYGTLGTTTAGQNQSADTGTQISAAGNAQALPAGAATRIATPVLFAVLALACAIAMFTRTVVFRLTSTSDRD